MATVTAPIMTDATGQSIDSKLNSLLGKMDNLAAAFQPNASGIVYSNTTSGLTGDDVQEAIDEMAADVSEIKSSLSNLHMGTMTKTFTNGYCEIATSDFGMSVKPTALVMTPCNQIIVMRYDYDGSSNSTVKVYVGNNYSGLLRFCYWAK